MKTQALGELDLSEAELGSDVADLFHEPGPYARKHISASGICTQALAGRTDLQYARRMGDKTVNSNVAALRKHLGLKQAAFAEQIEADQSYVSKWERDVLPGPRYLARMAELAGVSVDDFIDKEWRPNLRPSINAPIGQLEASDTVSIQKLDLSLSMGPGTLIDEWVEAEPVAFDLAFLRAITRAPSERLKLVTGIGDSMYPTLAYGDAIMIDTTDRALARQDGIYWINLYGAAGIKRLRTVGPGAILVKSDNPAVDDQEVSAEDLRIEGRAIWVARGL